MIKDYILKIHEFYYGRNNLHHYKNKNKAKWLLCNMMSFLCERILWLHMILCGLCGIKSKSTGTINEEIIISLTSFPARINTLWMVIDSLVRQSMCPRLIVLYLSVQDFPNREKDLPASLLDYVGDKFQISFVEENLMSHKKYYYAFQEYPDKVIVTVDDDNYYRRDTIERLWDIHVRYPQTVCANTVTSIADRDGNVGLYSEWNKNEIVFGTSSHNYLGIGASGILYPIGRYRESCCNEKNFILNCCLRADDLWLKCHELISNVKVSTGYFYSPALTIPTSQKRSLMSYNCSTKYRGNDIQWEALDLHFGVNSIIKKLLVSDK